MDGITMERRDIVLGGSYWVDPPGNIWCDIEQAAQETARRPRLLPLIDDVEKTAGQRYPGPRHCRGFTFPAQKTVHFAEERP